MWPQVVHLPSLVNLFLTHLTPPEGEWLLISLLCSLSPTPSVPLWRSASTHPLQTPENVGVCFSLPTLAAIPSCPTSLLAAVLSSTLEGNAGEGLGQLCTPRAEGHEGEWE